MFGYNNKYLLLHPWKGMERAYYQLKWFFQRAWRGYGDNDSWSLDDYLNSWLPQAIRSLKSGSGYPVDVYLTLYPNEDWMNMDPIHSTLAHAHWHEILESMAQGFEAAAKISAFEFDGATELDTLQRQMHEGLRLFSQYYQNLWD